jgi:hypothetical protein
MNKSGLGAIMLKNSICVISWAVLAVIFNKWWIALFATLFMTSCGIETVHRYYRVCDKCGKPSPVAGSYNEALDKAKASGWIHIVEGNKDYCPDCR